MYTYKDGYTALHWGARNGRNAVVELLLEAGPDIHIKDNVSICIICLYIQIIQMLTLFLVLISAPACNNKPTTSILPLLAPKCKAVLPPLYVYNNEMMMSIILQSYSQYHLLVLYYYYRLFSFLLYILLYCWIEIIYITTKIDTNLFKLCSKTRRVTTRI